MIEEQMIEDINLLMNVARVIIIAAVSLKVILAFLKCQTGSMTMPAAVEKAKKVIGAGIIASVLPNFLPFLASTYFNPEGVNNIAQGSNGAVMLINAFIGVIITLEPCVTVFYAMKELMQCKGEAEDYAKAEHMKRFKMIIGLGILIITCTEVIRVILSYFE